CRHWLQARRFHKSEASHGRKQTFARRFLPLHIGPVFQMVFVLHSKSMKTTSMVNTVFGHDLGQRPGKIYTENLSAGPYFPGAAFAVARTRRIPMYREENGKPF